MLTESITLSLAQIEISTETTAGSHEEEEAVTKLEREKVEMEVQNYRKQISQLEMKLESFRASERNLAGTCIHFRSPISDWCHAMYI